MSDPFSLGNRFAIVTGGTRGIGRAISLHFARAGARVLAIYVRNDEAAQKLEREAGEEKLLIDTCRADLTSKKGLEALRQAVGDTGGRIPVLLHCAATGVHRPLDQLTTRHFDWTFSLNVRAFFEIVKELLPLMCGGASIVAISSEGAVRAVQSYTVVGASKGALESLVRHLAVELAPRGVRVNALSPGSVQTEAWDVLPDKDQRLAEAVKRSPLGRLTSLEDVARAAHFLASDAASGVVGHTLVVDGAKRIVE